MKKHKSSLRRKCVARYLPDTQQGTLFDAPPAPAPAAPAAADFICPSPETIFVGTIPLRRYLVDSGLAWVIRLREELEQSDLSALLAGYAPMGRRAIHPVVLLGLIVYGMSEGKWSLRDLEQLARRDVGAWWLCGGLQPDHSTIGDFLRRQAAVLSEEYFVTLTRQLLRTLRLAPGTVAGDGTVLEAAASHYRALRAEAVRGATEQVAQMAAARAEQARVNGNDPKGVQVSPTEPEAVLQPLKNGLRRFSYQPSVLATAERLVVGQSVHPSNEAVSLRPLLAQHQRLWQAAPARLLLDARYHQHAILAWLGSWEVDVLCPSGAADRGQWERRTKRGAFDKATFVYDQERDLYRCPAGQELHFVGEGTRHDGQHYRRFGGAPCAACAQRVQCATARGGRTVKRFDGDEWKEAMTQVMRQPAARRAYRQRKAMVEPVFAALRQQQGLTRFHRRGLPGVRLEFALHCLAYNLRCALRLLTTAGPHSGYILVVFRAAGRAAILVFAFRLGEWSHRLKIHAFLLLPC